MDVFHSVLSANDDKMLLSALPRTDLISGIMILIAVVRDWL